MILKCTFCGEAEGKRICPLREVPICPLCCASSRNSQCRGCEYHHRGQFYGKEHIEVVTVMEKDLDFIQSEIEMAYNFIEMEEPELAEKIILPLIEHNPNSHNLQYAMGFIYLSRNEPDEAVSCFEMALALNPECPNTYYNLAAAYRDTGDFKGAVDCLLKVVELGDPAVEFVRSARDLLVELDMVCRKIYGIGLKEVMKCPDLMDTVAFRKNEYLFCRECLNPENNYANRFFPKRDGNLFFCSGKSSASQETGKSDWLFNSNY